MRGGVWSRRQAQHRQLPGQPDASAGLSSSTGKAEPRAGLQSACGRSRPLRLRCDRHHRPATILNTSPVAACCPPTPSPSDSTPCQLLPLSATSLLSLPHSSLLCYKHPEPFSGLLVLPWAFFLLLSFLNQVLTGHPWEPFILIFQSLPAKWLDDLRPFRLQPLPLRVCCCLL